MFRRRRDRWGVRRDEALRPARGHDGAIDGEAGVYHEGVLHEDGDDEEEEVGKERMKVTATVPRVLAWRDASRFECPGTAVPGLDGVGGVDGSWSSGVSQERLHVEQLRDHQADGEGDGQGDQLVGLIVVAGDGTQTAEINKFQQVDGGLAGDEVEASGEGEVGGGNRGWRW